MAVPTTRYDALDNVFNNIVLSYGDFTINFYTDNSGAPGSEATSMSKTGIPTGDFTASYGSNILTLSVGNTVDIVSSDYNNNNNLGTTVDIVWFELVWTGAADNAYYTLGWAKESSAITVATGQQLTVKDATFEYGEPGGDDLDPSAANPTTFNFPLVGVLEAIGDATDDSISRSFYTQIRWTMELADGQTATVTQSSIKPGGYDPSGGNPLKLTGLAEGGQSFDFETPNSSVDINYIQVELYNSNNSTWETLYVHDYSNISGSTAPSVDPPTTVNLDAFELGV